MSEIAKQFTVLFLTCPGRQTELFNAWSSMLETDASNSNVMVIFNPFEYSTHDTFLDMAEFRTAEILKFSTFHSISQCWNLGAVLSDTPYLLILSDDLIFQDSDVLQKIYEKHQEGHIMVRATEMLSAFSVHKSLFSIVGWFDERFPYSFEDIDYRYRMTRKGLSNYVCEPHLIKHTRSPAGRNQGNWDKSSEHFFNKWRIGELLDQDFSTPQSRHNFLTSGVFDATLDPLIMEMKPLFTPDFYPYYTQQFACLEK